MKDPTRDQNFDNHPYGLMTEYALNDMGIPNMILAIVLNER